MPMSVAVAVKAGDVNGSRRAVKWAVRNLLPKSDRFILVHVITSVTSVPTPSGLHIRIEDLDQNVVSLYVSEVKAKAEDVFIPYKALCKTRKLETLVLENDNPAAALLIFVSESGIDSLVMGSYSESYITRKLKGPAVPDTVLKSALDTCDIYIVQKNKLITKKLAEPLSATEFSSVLSMSTRNESYNSSQLPKTIFHEAPSVSGFNLLDYQVYDHIGPSVSDSEDNQLSPTTKGFDMGSSRKVDQGEIEELRQELQNTIALYKQASEELVHTQNKVQLLSTECLEETRKVNAARERESILMKIAAEEKSRYLQAIKEVEAAKNLLANESYERQIAELNALKESTEKQIAVDALLSSDKRYRRYTKEQIEKATDFFSESKVIGEGGYGKVFKCNIDHTPVAIKVIRSDAANKKEEFLREVEVLSQLRHPHIVLLLGACPENGCLVYEYLENRSLEECIFQHNKNPPLPWFVRFRIIFEVACGLAFLHNSKPEPVVHRDLKPGNILLDKNHVSKIGDVGLAKLISNAVPDHLTEYRDSVLAGTLFYMDPEYQRTGTVRPKSDLYAFGVIILQILTARRPNGLVLAVEKSISNGSLADILDKSIQDWPIVETEELVQMAMKCTKLRCRDRPDLDTEIMPILKRLLNVASAGVKVERNTYAPPSYYFCPILQEIMDDPYIASDGFTYEYRAIKAWLDKHNVSPVTKRRLENLIITPNHTLGSAIQEWRSHVNLQVP